MSAPTRTDTDNGLETPTMFPASMYAPPWARDMSGATEAALAAADRLRRALPPAPKLGEARRREREPAPFSGDIAIKHLRERPSLDPVAVPAPPVPEPGSTAGVLARVMGAIGLAALAAFFMVGTAPLSLALKAEGEGASLWSRLVTTSNRPQPANPAIVLASETTAPAALAERFAGVSNEPPPAASGAPKVVKTVALSFTPEPPAPQAAAAVPAVRSLDPDEIAMLHRRGEALIGQGDIAAARLLLTRAAEAGDARAALALGATYDAAVLSKLAVFGVAADTKQAHGWYAKAAEWGSGEATRRLERLAQSER